MTKIWTPQQEEIFRVGVEVKNSLMIAAHAGSAKTTTLEELTKRMQKQSALALSFGVKTTQELKSRLAPWVDVRTANSLGLSAWNSAIGKRCEVDKDKLYNLLRPYSLEEEDWFVVRDLVKNARNHGLVPKNSHGIKLVPDEDSEWINLIDATPSAEHIRVAREILTDCVSLSYKGIIDYDDMVYMSSLFGGIFPRYDLVLLDECQDLSILNHRQIARTATGRIIALGDAHQSIMAFRGADADSIQNLRKLRTDWLDLKLSVTFRCPKSVVTRRNVAVPDFTAHVDNLDGTVITFKGDWRWSDIPKIGSIAVLCSNNAPLIGMSLRLLRQGIAFEILGKEGHKALLAFAKKILPHAASAGHYATVIEEWREKEVAAAVAEGRENKLTGILDKAETLANVVNEINATSLEQIASHLKAIFDRAGDRVILSTGHKFKGLEADNVVFLDPWRTPSRFAKTPSDFQQAANLRHVIETRTKCNLILANLDGFVEG